MIRYHVIQKKTIRGASFRQQGGVSNIRRPSESTKPNLTVSWHERGSNHLSRLTRLRSPATGFAGEPVVVRHSYIERLTPQETFACAVGARKGLAQYAFRWDEMGQDARERGRPNGFNVLARGRRAKRRGIVFAQAAATGEVDPLTNVDNRIFVGLPVAGSQRLSIPSHHSKSRRRQMKRKTIAHRTTATAIST
jgi:hypothetical protein